MFHVKIYTGWDSVLFLKSQAQKLTGYLCIKWPNQTPQACLPLWPSVTVKRTHSFIGPQTLAACMYLSVTCIQFYCPSLLALEDLHWPSPTPLDSILSIQLNFLPSYLSGMRQISFDALSITVWKMSPSFFTCMPLGSHPPSQAISLIIF